MIATDVGDVSSFSKQEKNARLNYMQMKFLLTIW